MSKPTDEAMKAAEKYLRFKLGDRKGCHVLDYCEDEETERELIAELAVEFDKFKAK